MRTRIRLAQNFLRDPKLVEALVTDSNIGSDDVVYEIGPGEGIITKALAQRAKQVVAVEIDPTLASQLTAQFRDRSNVRIVRADFLSYQIRMRPYKVFSNIPFNITSEIVRKLLSDREGLAEGYLIVQKEAAEKFAGTPRETQFSVLAKPWFEMRIIWEFQRTDFEPVPSVDVVLLHIEKRTKALVPKDREELYQRFITYGFGAWKKDLKIAYKKVFTYEQWKRLARDLGFQVRPIPTELGFEQWLGLFRGFEQLVPEDKKRVVLAK
ncbi:MAG TPA: 23S ribosomal RNA methyltransferase Erm [Chloroflexia bacterium]